MIPSFFIQHFRQLCLALFALPLAACGRPAPAANATTTVAAISSAGAADAEHSDTVEKTDTATFAAGCFWCVEEQFKQLNGVLSVTSGFTGGHVANPSYELVCTGTTGHAEACNIVYDPSKISYDALLAAFFVAHDPTQLNRQGHDIGTQYRSAIFYHNDKQKQLAEYYIHKLDEEKAYNKKIVTAVSPYTKFYKAEDYHQNYYDNNKEQPYCQLVIKPKLDKFREVFKSKLKQQ